MACKYRYLLKDSGAFDLRPCSRARKCTCVHDRQSCLHQTLPGLRSFCVLLRIYRSTAPLIIHSSRVLKTPTNPHTGTVSPNVSSSLSGVLPSFYAKRKKVKSIQTYVDYAFNQTGMKMSGVIRLPPSADTTRSLSILSAAFSCISPAANR